MPFKPMKGLRSKLRRLSELKSRAGNWFSSIQIFSVVLASIMSLIMLVRGTEAEGFQTNRTDQNPRKTKEARPTQAKLWNQIEVDGEVFGQVDVNAEIVDRTQNKRKGKARNEPKKVKGQVEVQQEVNVQIQEPPKDEKYDDELRSLINKALRVKFYTTPDQNEYPRGQNQPGHSRRRRSQHRIIEPMISAKTMMERNGGVAPPKSKYQTMDVSPNPSKVLKLVDYNAMIRAFRAKYPDKFFPIQEIPRGIGSVYSDGHIWESGPAPAPLFMNSRGKSILVSSSAANKTSRATSGHTSKRRVTFSKAPHHIRFFYPVNVHAHSIVAMATSGRGTSSGSAAAGGGGTGTVSTPSPSTSAASGSGVHHKPTPPPVRNIYRPIKKSRSELSLNLKFNN